MLLSQLSSVTEGRGQSFLAQVLRRSKFLQNAQFREESTDFLHSPADDADQPDFRAVNGGYTPESDNPTTTAKKLAFLGKEATIDKSYKVDAEKGLINLDKYAMSRLILKAKSFAEGFEKQMMIADGTSNSTKGFSELITGAANVEGFGSTLTLNADADKLDISNSSNWSTLLEKLEEALFEVPGANAILLNRQLASRIYTIAREKHALTWDKNEFGVPVPMFNLVPIIPLADGAILNTEDSGAGTPTQDTTSLYVSRWEEYGGVSFGSNNGLEYTDFANLEDAVVSKARMELRYRPLIDSVDAIRRVRHIKLS